MQSDTPEVPQNSLYNQNNKPAPPKRKKLSLKLIAIFTALVLIGAGSYVGYRLLQPSSADVGRASGLNWPSGVHAANELGPHIQFGNSRGRPIDVLHTFTIRDRGWPKIIDGEPYFTDHKPFYDNKNHIYVISQPTFPKGEGNTSDCARGKYNDQWTKFGDTLVARGLNHQNTVVRIGWEFNGTFMYWHTDADPTNFKQCWRNVAKSIKAKAPNIRTDWTLNGHGGPVPAGGNMYAAYPGNDVVDIIGMDEYDHWPPARSDAEFDARCNKGGGSGVCDLARFARQNGKELSVGEWSVTGKCAGSARQGQNGGDSALYIRRMAQFFNANKDILAYEAYYDDPEINNVCSVLFRTNKDGSRNPNASAEYVKYFGKNSPYVGQGVARPSSGGGSSSGGGVSNKLVYGSDNRMYYSRDGKKSYIGNTPQVFCVKARRGTGQPTRVSQSVINNLDTALEGYCYYEQEPGLNFVREDGTNPVWLVQPGGTKLHVGVLCVPDFMTTQHKKFRLHIVPYGETAGHRQVGTFIGDPQKCGKLPG